MTRYAVYVLFCFAALCCASLVATDLQAEFVLPAAQPERPA